jgi:hypothetical protein
MKPIWFVLLPTERLIANVRRHWALLIPRTLRSFGLCVIGLVVWGGVGRLTWVPELLNWLIVCFLVFVVLRWVWLMLDWRLERLVVTDRRIVLVAGVGHRKITSISLAHTTLTYHRSGMGRILGYGELVIEGSQPVRRISYIPQPDKLYSQISKQVLDGE